MERAWPLAKGRLGRALAEGAPLGEASPELAGQPLLDVIHQQAGGALLGDVAVVLGRALPPGTA